MNNQKCPMDMKLLKLILLIQSYKQFKIREISFFGDIDKDNADVYTQSYFNSLPDDLLFEYNLRKNNLSFEKVLHYNVTEQIMRTEESELKQFDF